MQDIAKLHAVEILQLTLLFLFFVIVTTKRNMATSKISTTTIATRPPDRAAIFKPATAAPIGQYAAYRHVGRHALRHK